MDLIYMPEIMPYGVAVRPAIYYPDYEKPWNRDYLLSGKSSMTRYQQEQYQQQLRASKERDHCKLCRNTKLRSLTSYIRNKSKFDPCQEIQEEEEEEKEEENEDIDCNKTNNFVDNINNSIMREIPEVDTGANATTEIIKNDGNQSKPTVKKSRFSFRFKTPK